MKANWAVPCLDVFFCLLAAMLLSNPVFDPTVEDQIVVESPRAANTDGHLVVVGGALEWAIDAAGEVYEGGAPLSTVEIRSAAERAFDRGAQEAIVRADGGAPVEVYAYVLGELKAVGFQMIRLPVERTKELR